MFEKEIQIVAFNNPYPPDFGGAIDIFYKIKALSKLGVKVYLHVFYDTRNDISGLEPLCETINLYKQKKSILKHLSLLPYSVNSRFSKELIDNLNKRDAPILFESIRTTGILRKHKFKQKTAVRCQNIEHDYSWGLFKSERNWFKKMAFFLDGYKLKYYEDIFNKVDVLFPISYHEYSYYCNNFNNDIIYIPVFQGYNELKSENGFGNYALYHGDLAISDNIKSAIFIINVFKDLNEPLIIASSTVVPKILERIKKHDNISFQFISDEKQLKDLIQGAHINTLFSFQRSGTKLKVFTALFNGRFCILNKNMIDDPGILKLCEVAENKIEYQFAVKKLFQKNYSQTQDRYEALKKFDSKLNAEKLIEVLF
jgi:hypothetical protein